MVSVEHAKKIILKNISPLNEFEYLDISSSLGRVAAVDVKSREDIPPFDNSAMDGFAVRAKDTKGASRENPKLLEVIEDVPAGYVAKKAVRQNQAIRIMTGAPMPRGADAVVMVEETKKLRSQNSKVKTKELIQIFKEAKPAENVRYAGEDIRRGETVIKKGTTLKSGHIGMLASIGISKIKVSRKPKVAILATGDELIELEDKLEPGKIRNSNTYSLFAQVVKTGAQPIVLGIAKDKRGELKRKIKMGLDADMLLVSGGISVGDYDLVKDVLKDLGTRFEFWKVAMRPGKPLAFGMIKKIPVFGLPGNPVSSMVSFETFVRPTILKMLSQTIDTRKEVDAVLEEDIEKRKGLRYFLRAKTRWEDGVYLTRTSGPQGSGILKSMALSNSLIILPEEEERIEKGRRVTVRFLD